MGWRWWVAVAGRAGRCRGGPGAAGDLQGTCLSFMGLQSSQETQPPGPLPTLSLSCPGKCLFTHAPYCSSPTSALRSCLHPWFRHHYVHPPHLWVLDQVPPLSLDSLIGLPIPPLPSNSSFPSQEPKGSFSKSTGSLASPASAAVNLLWLPTAFRVRS